MARIQASSALSSLRVLDLTRVRAGPVCARHFADFGADVIKVETTGEEDLGGARDGPDFQNLHRNKRSITLDLKAPEGIALFRQLVQTADIVIENYRPDVKDRLGIDYVSLRAVNPRIILASISGFGQDGPYRDRPGCGTLVEAMSGFASKNGFEDRPPVLPPLAMADMIAGLYGAYAIMVALRVVEAGGKGQVIDLPLLDPIISILGPDPAIYQVSGQKPQRSGSRSLTTSPRNAYETSDGRYIAISASIQAMAERLFRAIGRADMIDDPKFRTNTDRVRNIDECDGIVADFILARTLKENMDIFSAAEVTATPIYEVDQLIEDPHVQERGILVEAPDEEAGTVLMHNVIPRLSDTPGRIRTPAPNLGQHTHAILQSLGYDPARIAAMVADGVIKEA